MGYFNFPENVDDPDDRSNAANHATRSNIAVPVFSWAAVNAMSVGNYVEAAEIAQGVANAEIGPFPTSGPGSMTYDVDTSIAVGGPVNDLDGTVSGTTGIPQKTFAPDVARVTKGGEVGGGKYFTQQVFSPNSVVPTDQVALQNVVNRIADRTQHGSTATLPLHSTNPINLVAHVASTAATTPAINTTGATLIVVGMSANANSGAAVAADSKGNTWTALTNHTTTGASDSRLFYCFNPITDPAHTFSPTWTKGATFVAAFGGTFSAPSNSSDTGNTLATSPTSINCPSGSGNLLLTHVVNSSGTAQTYSVDSSFIIIDQLSAGGNSGTGALAFKVALGTPGTESPTWTYSSAPAGASASMAGFEGYVVPPTSVSASN